MNFEELYRMHVVTNGNAGTIDAVGSRFIEEYLQDKEGTVGDRFMRAYGKLEGMFRECNSNPILNLRCFAWCNDLLRQETK